MSMDLLGDVQIRRQLVLDHLRRARSLERDFSQSVSHSAMNSLIVPATSFRFVTSVPPPNTKSANHVSPYRVRWPVPFSGFAAIWRNSAGKPRR